MSKEELLERASKFIFSTGLNDSASKLSTLNMKYGLAQFHLIQEKYGLEPNANFISSPDETVTRNIYRWSSGIGYGGKINWGNGTEKIIFLNVKPNLCGILAGGLNEFIEPEEIIRRIEITKQRDLSAKQIPLNWDYQTSNHFINLFKTQNFSETNLPPYVFFIHGSSPELQDDKYGIGLYVDKSKTLRDKAIPYLSSCNSGEET
jgi:hypothetical protein